MIAEVVLNVAANDLNRVFDYGVPNDMDVVVGMRVLVPFGKRKTNEIGYVIGLKESSKYQCKEIVRVVENVLDEEKLALAKWMSEKYFCNLSETIKLFVPPGTLTNVDDVKDKKENMPLHVKNGHPLLHARAFLSSFNCLGLVRLLLDPESRCGNDGQKSHAGIIDQIDEQIPAHDLAPLIEQNVEDRDQRHRARDQQIWEISVPDQSAQSEQEKDQPADDGRDESCLKNGIQGIGEIDRQPDEE